MRITNKMVQIQVGHINDLTKDKRNMETYCIDDYFGVTLVLREDKTGAISHPLGHRRFTKRELHEILNAFIEGIKLGAS